MQYIGYQSNSKMVTVLNDNCSTSELLKKEWSEDCIEYFLTIGKDKQKFEKHKKLTHSKTWKFKSFFYNLYKDLMEKLKWN